MANRAGGYNDDDCSLLQKTADFISPILQARQQRDRQESGRLRAEKTLTESEQKYRALIEATLTGYVILDSAGRVVDANAECVRLTGRKCLEDIRGRSVVEWTAPHDQRRNAEAVQRCVQAGSVRHFELDYVGLAGGITPVELNARTLSTAEGVMILTLCWEATERKRLRAQIEGVSALRESLLRPGDLAAKLREIADAIVALFQADFARVWITRPGDLCASGCIHAAQQDGPNVCRSRERCLHLLASSGRYTHTDGGHRRVPFGAYKIGQVGSGQLSKFLTNSVLPGPEHSRPRLGEGTRVRRLCGLSAHLGLGGTGWCHGVVHQAAYFQRGSCTAGGTGGDSVRGYPGLPGRGGEGAFSRPSWLMPRGSSPSEGSPAGSHTISTICSRPFSAMWNSLSARLPSRANCAGASRKSANQRCIPPNSPANSLPLRANSPSAPGSWINETVGSTLKMLGRLLGEDIRLVWAPAPQLWPVRIDPTQVNQILANLAVNARDAIQGPGRITLETSKVTLAEDDCRRDPDCAPGDYVMLAITDNGRGMDVQTQGHLFEPFFTTKPLGFGTGLGLATVFGIVKQNNGLIAVESRPNVGTVFRVYLPRAEPVQTQAQPPAASLSLGGAETVLLVEDQPQISSWGSAFSNALAIRCSWPTRRKWLCLLPLLIKARSTC